MTKRKVLLIGWDAADWEHINPLLEENLMPTLDGLINRGVIGNLATLQPVLSPMLWNSIATGKLADKHGIHGFIEPDPVNGGARPYASTSRKVKALWNMLTQSGLRSNVVGWWASHPAEPINGTVVTSAFTGVRFEPGKGWHVPPGTIHPPEKEQELGRFRVFPSELTEAHVLPFIPEAATIDQEEEKGLEPFAKVLSDAASVHSVATVLMETEEWDFTAVYYDAIDHFSHAFMQYHPPKLAWIDQRKFDLYKDVVRGAYRFHDMMLERLLQLAGPDTTVILCSDHGFESGSQRPHGVPREPAGPAVWHRQYGIFVIAGPGIKKDERIYGASLVDITPTILSLFDLPIGEDMDGRPLLEVFETPPVVATIPSWEKLEGDAGMHSGDVALDHDQAQDLMQQFAALGYIEDPNADREKQAESADIEAKYNVARTILWSSRPDEAIPLFAEIVQRRPWEDRFLFHLAAAYFQAGYLRQSERVLAAAYDLRGEIAPHVRLLWGRIKIALGEREVGLEALLAIEKTNARQPGLYTQLGDLYTRLGRLDEAEKAYKKALEMDPEGAIALQGLSTISRQRGQNQETVDYALRAVSLLHRLPLAHFNLGVAMARAGETERAIVAFNTALRFQPNLLNAHRYLATLYGMDGANPQQAGFHRHEVRRLMNARPVKSQRAAERREKLFDLPPIPDEKERGQILLRERPDPTSDEKKSGKTFILVSGLPRSGTSLMMQMLEKGGARIMTDGERIADVDNPRGYYEWEAIKQIGRKPELLDDPAVEGAVIKCISMLLPQLPRKHRYKIIFMTRAMEEVLASQSTMIGRLGTEGAKVDPEQLERGLNVHREDALRWMKGMRHIDFVEVDYAELVRAPQPIVATLAEFLGPEVLPNAAEMAAVVDPALYRKRHRAEGVPSDSSA